MACSLIVGQTGQLRKAMLRLNINWQFCLHLFGILNCVSADYYFKCCIDLPSHGDFSIFHNHGGRLKFLTVWNLIFQGAMFTMCVINDLIANDKNRQRPSYLGKCRDLLFCSVVFPLSLFVSLCFWTIFLYDRQLVFPRELDDYFPLWLNHIMHTNVVVLALVEMFTTYHAYPSRIIGLSTLLALIACYIFWIFDVYFTTSMWIYPIFGKLSWLLRTLFLSGAIMFVIILYVGGEKLNKRVWGENYNNDIKDSASSIKNK